MDAKTKSEIAEITRTVSRLLNSSSSLNDVNKIRSSASKKLNMDLSQPSQKAFVRSLVELFVVELQAKKELEEKKVQAREYDDSNDLVVCRLSSNRKVTITKYKEEDMVSIRQYYLGKNGKEEPSEKGIHLPLYQWTCLKNKVLDIEDAIKKMERLIELRAKHCRRN